MGLYYIMFYNLLFFPFSALLIIDRLSCGYFSSQKSPYPIQSFMKFSYVTYCG